MRKWYDKCITRERTRLAENLLIVVFKDEVFRSAQPWNLHLPWRRILCFTRRGSVPSRNAHGLHSRRREFRIRCGYIRAVRTLSNSVSSLLSFLSVEDHTLLRVPCCDSDVSSPNSSLFRR